MPIEFCWYLSLLCVYVYQLSLVYLDSRVILMFSTILGGHLTGSPGDSENFNSIQGFDTNSFYI